VCAHVQVKILFISYSEWSKIKYALLPFFFYYALEYAIRKVHENQKGLELSVIHQLLVYADDTTLGKKI
jgi:hypothetical protein